MDRKKQKKEEANANFNREELGPLLKLFSSLGITMTVGIIGFFLLGSYVDKSLRGLGMTTYGIPRIILVLGGVGLSGYWCYMRIARHLKKYETPPEEDDFLED